ncbi:hypothetical protein D3C73_587780 [compost metagenome]
MTYGAIQYGAFEFGSSDSDGVILPPNVNLNLMKYLPAFYQEIKEMRELQATAAEEIGMLHYRVEDILNQYFIETATWGLDQWENQFGLSTDRTKSYEIRREMVKAKLRGAGTTTKQMIVNAAAAFSGGEVSVQDYPEEYRFEVQFIGFLGIPPNMAGFIGMLEEIKPAHLTYSFKYTYTAWNMLANLQWSQAKTKTWNELRVYEGA